MSKACDDCVRAGRKMEEWREAHPRIPVSNSFLGRLFSGPKPAAYEPCFFYAYVQGILVHIHTCPETLVDEIHLHMHMPSEVKHIVVFKPNRARLLVPVLERDESFAFLPTGWLVNMNVDHPVYLACDGGYSLCYGQRVFTDIDWHNVFDLVDTLPRSKDPILAFQQLVVTLIRDQVAMVHAARGNEQVHRDLVGLLRASAARLMASDPHYAALVRQAFEGSLNARERDLFES